MRTCRWKDCEADALPGKLYCKDHRMTGPTGWQRSGRTRGAKDPNEKSNQQNPGNGGDGKSNPAMRSEGDGEPAGGGSDSGRGGKEI